jgi:soluble lytic murein transglycosylase-like protein
VTRIGLCIACVSVALAAPAHADGVARWRAYIDDASSHFGVPVPWIERVMRAESGGRTMRGGRPIRSRAGAMGLMQLMPATWAEMRTRLGLGPNPDDPRDNILAGTYYLRLMYDRFGYPGLFGAYNAGPARYAAHLGGARLPAETIAYLRMTGGTNPRPLPENLPLDSPRATLFALAPARAEASGAEPVSSTVSPIFAIRHDSR